VSFLHRVCLLIEIVVVVSGFSMVNLLGIPSLMANTSMGGTIIALGLRGVTDNGLHLVVLVVLTGDVWVFYLGVIGRILLTPVLSKWHDTSLTHFTLTPVLSCLLTLALIFYFAGGRHGEVKVDQLRLLSTHDCDNPIRDNSVLSPNPLHLVIKR
jgi:hypothetical protein